MGIIRNETARLSATIWGEGHSVWEPDGVTPEVEFLGVHFHQGPPEIAGVLGLVVACIRSRRYLLDGAVIIGADSYIPNDLADGTAITLEDTGPGGTFARLAEIGHAPESFREDVMVMTGADIGARHLVDDPDRPLLVSIRTAFDAAGRAVECSQLIHDPARVTLRFEFLARPAC